MYHEATFSDFQSDRLRYTGAPVVCANVLQWAPSRVTRRGAPAATAAAAAFPPLPHHLPPSSSFFPVSPHIHVRLLLPLGGLQSPWSRGPLGTPISPPRGPMVAWQATLPPSPPQNTPSLFRLLPNGATDDSPPLALFHFLSFSPFPYAIRSPTCHATTFFLFFRFSRPWRSCKYQYSIYSTNVFEIINFSIRCCWLRFDRANTMFS